MHKAVFFIQARGGTELSTILLDRHQERKDISNGLLRSSPPVPFQYHGTDPDTVINHQGVDKVWAWGFGPGVFTYLPSIAASCDTCSFVRLVRDPRSHIDSLRNWHKSDLSIESFLEYIDYMLLVHKDLMANAINRDDFYLVKFEDLTENYVDTTYEIIQKLGFSPDIDSIQKGALLLQEGRSRRGDTSNHSSFGSQEGCNNRWEHRWSQEEKDIFKDKAGHILIDLGYEANNDW